jgi:hypothetical protein
MLRFATFYPVNFFNLFGGLNDWKIKCGIKFKNRNANVVIILIRSKTICLCGYC